MAEDGNIEFQNDQITLYSLTDAETQCHVDITSYTCQTVGTEPITITTYPDDKSGVISIVENSSDWLQICDDEQVNLDISTYPSGAENSDNGTPAITGWSYQWLINVGGDPLNDDQYVPVPGDSANTLYTTEFLQGAQDCYFNRSNIYCFQNCGPRRTEHIHVEVLEELNAGHLNDIPDYLCFEETANISFQTNPTGGNIENLSSDYRYSGIGIIFEEELGDTTDLNNWELISSDVVESYTINTLPYGTYFYKVKLLQLTALI